MCPKICELDPSKYLSAPGLAWQVVLENTKVKLYLLAHINMLSMIQKGIREEYITLFVDMQKLITRRRKNMIKIKKCLIFNIVNIGMLGCKYWDVNNLYGWAMSQKLWANNFDWIEDTFQFNEDFIQKWRKWWRIFS